MMRKWIIFTVLLSSVAVAAVAAVFDHAAHDTYIADSPCVTCHQDEARSIVPPLKVCLDCHDQAFVDAVSLPGTRTHGTLWALQHRPFAKGKSIDCAACHEQDFCLECHKSGFADEQGDFGNALTNVHRSDFHVTHPIAARTDPQLCSSCHEPKFCSDCHNDFAPADLAIRSHRRGWSDIAVAEAPHSEFTEDQCQICHPDSVLPRHEWTSDHAREARRYLVTCQTCHPDGDVCLQCHSARSGLMVNPHPDDWDDIKGRLKRASDGKTCRKCH